MCVADFDGDGDADVVTSAAHKIGIWWHEQKKDGWQTHEIDNSFSQSHSLCLADFNGDNLPDFVTGKRWWAHGPSGDPDPDKPAVVVWFELVRKMARPSLRPTASTTTRASALSSRSTTSTATACWTS